jgi:tellurite methyltransferase
VNWSAYFAATLDRPLPFLEQVEPHLPHAGRAIDLGCGVGHATLAMLDRGLEVVAVDAEAEAIEILRGRLPEGAPCTVLQTRFEELDLEVASFDVAFSRFSLFFLPRKDFDEFWPRLVVSLKPGGIFAGQLLGPRDDWATRGYATHTALEVAALFEGFELLHYEEAERDGTTVTGEAKHWHVFHVVGRRLHPQAPSSSCPR